MNKYKSQCCKAKMSKCCYQKLLARRARLLENTPQQPLTQRSVAQSSHSSPK